MINEFFKNITLASFTLEMIHVGKFMTLIIAITDTINNKHYNLVSYNILLL